MSIESERKVVNDDQHLRESLFRSLVTPYWKFNVLEVAYATVGMALAAVAYDWSWTIWGLASLCLWMGSAGSNNIDLADEGLTLDVDSRVQYAVGGTMIAFGGVTGVVLASMTSWWFLAFVAAGALSTLAYDLEWFDGVFHDRDSILGLANFGFAAAWIPVVGGYFLLSQQVALDLLGIAIVAVSPTLHLLSWNILEDDLKEQKYEAFGIIHSRDVEPDYDRLLNRAGIQPLIHITASSVMAVGLVILYVS